MRKAAVLKLMKKIGLIGLALNLAAFTAPQKDDLLELKGSLYGRSQARFRTIDNNKVLVLKKGTRAVVKEVEYFSGTGNYGLCLEIHNATDVKPEDKCVWVYYNVKNPAMNIYTGIVDKGVKQQILAAWAKDGNKVTLKRATSPEKAEAVQTTRAVSGVVEKKSSTPINQETASSTPATGADPKPTQSSAADTKPNLKEIDTDTVLKSALNNVDQFNKKSDQVMSSANQCPDGKCNAKIESYEKCNSKNDYLENSLSALINQSPLSSIFQSTQKEFIRESCIKRNLEVFKSGPFQVCSGNSGANTKVRRACISQNYVDVTAKSFNLVADCLGKGLTGSEEAKSIGALTVFSLMSIESGMHVNAKSPTGPGGVGQLSHYAIADVNARMKKVQSQLAASKNPLCSKNLAKVLNSKMDRKNTCDRIGLSKDNPLKNMAYTYIYQTIARESIDKLILETGTFKVLTSNLPRHERDRLVLLLSSWAHNTGIPGLLKPLRAKLMTDLANRKKVSTAADVDRFLKELRPFLASHAHPGNRAKRRLTETMNYYNKMQARMDLISKERNSCLAQ